MQTKNKVLKLCKCKHSVCKKCGGFRCLDSYCKEHYPAIFEQKYKKVLKFALTQNRISTADLQYRFKIGYVEAHHLMDKLEENGIIENKLGAGRKRILKNK